jgi:leader peptidase (prepilin peptidase)/N-methyltransferase
MPEKLFPVILPFLFGLIIGSFLNVLIYRLPRGRSVIGGRSKCTRCKNTIAWYDNIPVLSYLILRGKCRHCGERISPRYPIVELFAGCLAALVGSRYGFTLETLWVFVFLAVLLVITLIDWSHQIIPDVLSLGGIVFGWIGAIVCLDISLVESLIGTFVGGGLLFAIAGIYRLVRKVDGMGGGDIKLMGMIGAFVGWQLIFPVLVLASFFGALYGVYLLRRGATSQTAVAFGSFLAPAAAVVYVSGATLWRLYLEFFLGKS